MNNNSNNNTFYVGYIFGSHVLLWATGVVVVNPLPCTSLTKGVGRG